MSGDLRAELTGWEKRYPCEHECVSVGSPEEDCSRHGRTPGELWPIISAAYHLIAAVRALHKTHVCTGYPDCMNLFGGECAYLGTCAQCRREHPCPTIRALLTDGGQS